MTMFSPGHVAQLAEPRNHHIPNHSYLLTGAPSLSLASIIARSATPVTIKESPMPRGEKDAKPAKAKVEAELAAVQKLLKSEASRRRHLEKRLTEAKSLYHESIPDEVARLLLFIGCQASVPLPPALLDAV
jgi:hypothetical protein